MTWFEGPWHGVIPPWHGVAVPPFGWRWPTTTTTSRQRAQTPNREDEDETVTEPPDPFTPDNIEAWMRNQNATLIGRPWNTHERDDRAHFVQFMTEAITGIRAQAATSEQ